MQSFNWHSYYRLDDIYDWLEDLSDRYPDEVRLRTIGKSYENRTIVAVKLTLRGSIRRGKIIVEGGCHGNEWISPAFVTYMLHTLLNFKEYENEELETIALMYSWIFVPVMNPDGYEYAHTTDRLWRKNRRGGYGVDLNRNYGIGFGAHCPDKSNTENREHCGDSPFSEPESEAMSLFTKDNSDNLEYYLSFHSYGQHIILPYSVSVEHTDNYNVVSVMYFITAGFFIFLLITRCDSKSYKNYALLRGVPYDESELIFFKTLDKVYDVTWWKEPTQVQKPVEFSIAPRNLAALYRDTEKMTVRFMIVIRNLQGAFDKQKATAYFRRNMASFNWHNFYRLDDIYDWLKDVSSQYPEEVQLRRVGTTHENRTIMAARLRLKGSKNRSKVIVEGGCHAREWLSPAVVTYMLYTLLNANKYKDKELEHIAYTYTWVFIPVMNPDGYEYSHTTDRLWRKNRRPGGAVDLNRNYGIAFGSHGASNNPTSIKYCGDSPFSEPETHFMATMAREHRHKLEYYISFHSYGQFLIIPYSHLIEHEDNYDQVKKLADKATQRMNKNHGITYKSGTAFETIAKINIKAHFFAGYLASGTSSDWVKRALNVSYVLTIELPDTGAHGYALPPGRILPSCQAVMDGLLEILTPQSKRFLRTNNAVGKNRLCVKVIFFCNVFVYIMRYAINYLC
ncbi:zinc carboxypeptidase A 1-like [Cydia splendana]|uniref:zinc carboxypeptidase A 1-like n=1 Tax=Cydia splendana TaxID=1100963 RepID=UPI00300C90FD